VRPYKNLTTYFLGNSVLSSVSSIGRMFLDLDEMQAESIKNDYQQLANGFKFELIHNNLGNSIKNFLSKIIVLFSASQTLQVAVFI